jgi:hypothetical protein
MYESQEEVAYMLNESGRLANGLPPVPKDNGQRDVKDPVGLNRSPTAVIPAEFGGKFVSLCKACGGDPKAIADQCGHDIGVSVNVYTQSTLDSKLELVNRLERSLKAPVVN